jgi:hypothetical protein
VDQAHAARDRRLSEYYDAARALKVLTNLEIRARAAHRLAADREEQTALDERATIAGAHVRRYLS